MRSMFISGPLVKVNCLPVKKVQTRRVARFAHLVFRVHVYPVSNETSITSTDKRAMQNYLTKSEEHSVSFSIRLGLKFCYDT